MSRPCYKVALALFICATFLVCNIAFFRFRFAGAPPTPLQHAERAAPRGVVREQPRAPEPRGATAVPLSDVDGDALVRVFDDAAPLLRAADARGCGVRPRAAVHARRRFHSACLALNPGVAAYQSMYASNERTAGRERSRNTVLPHERRDDEFEVSRTFLASHGSAVNARLLAFSRAHNLSAPADWRSSTGYAGPWIEDHWRRTFHAPVRIKISVDAAVRRDGALRARRPPADDSGTRFIVVACDADAELSDDWSDVDASVRRGTCERCSVALSSVAAMTRYLRAAPSCALFEQPSTAPPAPGRARAAWNLYLELQYDAELFHPFVPLFIPFENFAFARNVRAKIEAEGAGPGSTFHAEVQANPSLASLPLSLLDELTQLLGASVLPGVQYVTVCQRPAGIAFERTPVFVQLLAQTLVLSAGGNGHVPLPLLTRILPRLEVGDSAAGASDLAAVRVPPHGTASHLISFVGSAREGTRETAITTLQTLVEDFVHVSLPNDPLVWVKHFVDATFALSPSGVGITSFRLYEALQLGVPPVYVYKDRPWLPYMHESERTLVSMGNSEGDVAASALTTPNLPPPRQSRAAVRWTRLAQLVDIDGFTPWVTESLLKELKDNSTWWYAARDEMARLRESHFTYEGVVAHIREFLEDPWDAELQCVSAAVESIVLT
jgi:hypothetical protein